MSSLDNIRIVLVNPVYGGNMGSVCRAMANMGLSQLAVVNPRSGMNMDQAGKMACHANEILKSRKLYDTTAEAVADCGLVAGTSNRGGLYREHSKTSRGWAPRLLEAAADTPVAILFGAEDNGLSLEDLALCTQFIRIPSSEDYKSLNLAMSVMCVAYDLFVAADIFQLPTERSQECVSSTREAMFEKWREGLLGIGFMSEETSDHMMLGIRRILSRGTLTTKDVQILIGMAAQVQWAAGEIAKHNS
jgi:tRNA/rRNA methyltransferase